jgi:hypothetical protein
MPSPAPLVRPNQKNALDFTAGQGATLCHDGDARFEVNFLLRVA